MPFRERHRRRPANTRTIVIATTDADGLDETVSGTRMKSQVSVTPKQSHHQRQDQQTWRQPPWQSSWHLPHCERRRRTCRSSSSGPMPPAERWESCKGMRPVVLACPSGRGRLVTVGSLRYVFVPRRAWHTVRPGCNHSPIVAEGRGHRSGRTSTGPTNHGPHLRKPARPLPQRNESRFSYSR